MALSRRLIVVQRCSSYPCKETTESGFVFDPVSHCVDTEIMVWRTMGDFRDTGFMFGSFSVNVRLLARGQSSDSFEVNLAFVKETMPAVSVYLDI